MADASAGNSIRNGSTRTRRLREGGSSRNSSARSSTVYNDDFLQPGYGSTGLRSSTSRFSLNEQFAATRREYEFDYDDTSSTLGRSTIASEAMGDQDVEDAEDEDMLALHAASRGRDLYELLCLPRNSSAHSIRRAYHRLFVLLYPDSHPRKVRAAADVYFTTVQTAFETLIDPCRRLQYDLDSANGADQSSSLETQDQDYRLWHAELLRHHLLHPNAAEDHDGLELSVRFGEGPSGLPNVGHRHQLEPVDFAMGQSFSIPLSILGGPLDHAFHTIRNWMTRATPRDPPSVSPDQPDCINGQIKPSLVTYYGPLLTIRASIYGLLQDLMSIPVDVLADPYQPTLATEIPRDRVLQLLDGRIHPLLSVKFQHQLPPSGPTKHGKMKHGSSRNKLSLDTSSRGSRGAIVELESDIIPSPALATRMSTQVLIPCDTTPSSIQIAAKTAPWNNHFPRIGANLQRPTAGGLLMCNLDSGDWTSQADLTCSAFTQFTRMKQQFLSLDIPLRIAPKIEVAYKMGGSFKPSATCISDRATERGLRSLEWGMEHDGGGSWTVSTTGEVGYVGSSIRYGLDVNVPSSKFVGNGPTCASPGANRTSGRGVRLEAELASNSLWTTFMALRCLKRIGRFSKVGFEVGLSTNSLHLSVYWSRLGQRISLPFLMRSRATLNAQLLFWTTLVPFVGFAAWEYAGYRRRRNNAKRRDWRKDLKSKRAEADEVNMLLAANVEKQQKSELARGGLVILNAKYGVKAADESNAWGAEEVADVTIAVAALVDNGELLIPEGVDKSQLLGFWDPVPTSAKALHVRYLYQGKEQAVEVIGEQQLLLPSVKD
ncbi:uncharacterized protein BCR38DRAFT_332747 [Pseudomassariella vexata]|uniref:J domain-containing protein n=1 Tax=Pseudomassariella vexata TaxID=1141098 RepID=A0A1Y2EF98_9PEZI|nr:uncharacterized protein BCR38DRAFT_332747 [Pseudomassariella vexata]ORY70229.1 hypothetical protein BCR38DRAFT_332747 [Pseudomassariella vexata]